eukprot:CAMPEP_0176231610 /NCGR_PEP_ID=MMETSP0121_2-20121125/24886_1 /TAXON_ID=160619 /ORGANISM="Kryptoperidinium foliaceum, Strain CCMP 1326" /LENGTH=420 /DNA_ID=CAMNT_0017570955 /DNA_START=88 /DNA_END=1346 /DNA_ORIENTATION=+
MTELQLDALDENLPRDCFMSVRIGEVQKLSRLTGSRSFKFPPTAKGRFGKIEIFRRIGAASVDLDPDYGGDRRVNIGLQGADTECLPFRVCIGTSSANKTVASPADIAAKNTAKTRAAKEYLGKHQLEVRLAEAMQAVLRERPDDPLLFLARQMTKAAGGEAAPGPTPATAAAQAKPAAPAPTVAGASRPSISLTPFGAYYKAHFGSAGPAARATLYGAFVGRPKVSACAVAEPKAATPVAAGASRPAISLTPFGAYYKAHFGSAGPAARATLYGAFAGRPKASACAAAEPKTQELVPFGQHYASAFRLAPPKAIAAVYQGFPAFVGSQTKASTAVAPGAFRKKPSVGTWLARAQRIPAAPAAPPSQEARRPFAKLPSVGTWLALRPVLAAEVAPAAPAVRKDAPRRDFAKLPSVGTWLA